MNNYLVIADDLTGANDTGVQIRRRGIPVQVVFNGSQVSGEGSFVVDTESRFLSEAGAQRKILDQACQIPFKDFTRVFKKVDSTLRGHVAAELQTLAQCVDPELVIFAPAFPDLGRTTLRGIHQINGTPISKTEFTRDPKAPAKSDDVLHLMKEAFAGIPGEVFHVPLEELREGRADLSRGRVFCFDALTNSDLQEVVRLALAQDRRILWVGCAGLADMLLSLDVPVPPVLAIIGSQSSVTRDQVLFAEGQGIQVLKIDLRAILAQEKGVQDIVRDALHVINQGKDLILLSSSTHPIDDYQKTQEEIIRSGMNPEVLALFIQDLIGDITMMILRGLSWGEDGGLESRISGLFLSGGDTAMCCFEKSGALGSAIVKEISTGIPLLKLLGGIYPGLRVVTKAGAFGREDAIFYGIRKLKEPD
ncbi:MAG: four-carbon acid sugar kinase family protein [Treponema sp.]|nr:four-carbon acid sugar kinase family protein [Treponema sp.]